MIDLRDVVIRAGSTPILSFASLAVAAGECVGISGPNGSGKTTLLRVLATLRRPNGGEGKVLGAALGGPQVRSVRPRIGLLGHQPALAPELTLADNLRFHASLHRRSAEAAESALDTVGLNGAMDRRAADCSTGMLRRADLGRILMIEPELLLLDEPTDGLDHEARPLVKAAVRRCLERDGAAVLVSHDASTFGDLATRVLTLEAGVLRL